MTLLVMTDEIAVWVYGMWNLRKTYSRAPVNKVLRSAISAVRSQNGRTRLHGSLNKFLSWNFSYSFVVIVVLVHSVWTSKVLLIIQAADGDKSTTKTKSIVCADCDGNGKLNDSKLMTALCYINFLNRLM